MRRYDETKSVDDLPERGTWRSTKKDDKASIKIFRKNPECSLWRAKNLLLKIDEISLDTIRLDSEYGWRSTKCYNLF